MKPLRSILDNVHHLAGGLVAHQNMIMKIITQLNILSWLHIISLFTSPLEAKGVLSFVFQWKKSFVRKYHST